MSDCSREMMLSEIVRSLPTNHRAYREYANLLGKEKLLADLEDSLRAIALNCERVSDRLPPELKIFNELQLVKAKLAAIIEAQNPTPTTHRLGLE